MNKTEKYLTNLIGRMSEPSKEICFNDMHTDIQEKRHMKPILKLAVIFAAFFLMISSVPAMAQVSYILERMKALSDEETVELAEMTDKQGIEADLYSRELSDDERSRMLAIRKDYVNGVFPENSIVVLSEGETKEVDFYYDSSTGMFFLPDDRYLTDKELAQLIDFYYKRDYSLRARIDNEKSAQSSTLYSIDMPAGHVELISRWLAIFNIDNDVLSDVKIQKTADGVTGYIYSFSNEEFNFTCTVADDEITYFKREENSSEKYDLMLSENNIEDKIKSNIGIVNELINMTGNEVQLSEAWLLYKLDNEGVIIDDTYALVAREDKSDIGWYISFEHDNTIPSAMRKLNVVNYFESIENGKIIAESKGINDKIIELNIENGDFIE